MGPRPNENDAGELWDLNTSAQWQLYAHETNDLHRLVADNCRPNDDNNNKPVSNSLIAVLTRISSITEKRQEIARLPLIRHSIIAIIWFFVLVGFGLGIVMFYQPVIFMCLLIIIVGLHFYVAANPLT